MKFCGIDLAVKRPSAVGIMEGDTVCVVELDSDEDIYKSCNDAVVIAIDSPLSHSNGYREVDKMMKKKGFRVLPPSWMRSLVERALKLQNSFSQKSIIIETHPTSSMKNLGINWRDIDRKKDIVDALFCALVSFYYYRGIAERISAKDGEIYIMPKDKLNIERVNDNCFKIFSRFLQVTS